MFIWSVSAFVLKKFLALVFGGWLKQIRLFRSETNTIKTARQFHRAASKWLSVSDFLNLEPVLILFMPLVVKTANIENFGSLPKKLFLLHFACEFRRFDTKLFKWKRYKFYYWNLIRPIVQKHWIKSNYPKPKLIGCKSKKTYS